MSSLPRVMFLTKFFVFLLVLLANLCRADEIQGFCGYIKSHAKIDFSQITIKLYTKSGSLKDKTECAPNTGYYFLPVYNNGEYVLKLEPPRGWSFEPLDISLNVDESSKNLCSHGKDINFIFKGFGITGKVTTASSVAKSGPKGITVSLYDKSKGKTLLGSTETSDGGTFSFTPIQPGEYLLTAQHPTWLMEKHSTVVTVKEGNTELKDGELSVFGFDVSGKVTTTEGEPVGKVSFLLFGNGQAKNCATTPVNGFDSKKKPLCHVISDETGRFLFPALSSGEYSIVPYYAGSKTKFDVKPSELPFIVLQDSIILSQEFKVTGFSVSGKIMASIDPPIPLAGAKVFLSKKQIGVTDNNGVYKIDNIKAKQYMLFAEASDVKFEEKNVKVSPSNPELPIITPSAFKITGKVSSSTKENLQSRKIAIKNMSTNQVTEIEADSKGEWSTYLSPAKYQLNVIVSDDEKIKGLQFFPLQRLIEINSKSINNINFLQLKASLKGTILCLPDKDLKAKCSETQVTLKMVDGVVETKTVNAKDGEYIFEDVLPGQYEVIVDTDIFCWDNSNRQVVIASENPPNVPPFKQTGFSITFISSHDTLVEYSVPHQTNKKNSFELLKGSTRHCLPVSGNYEFYPKGCHKYEKISYTWNTKDQAPIILSTSEHLLSGNIVGEVSVNDVTIKIEGESEGQSPQIIKDLKIKSSKSNFQFYGVAGEAYVITPSSESLLFDPPSLKIIAPDDCNQDVAVFQAQQGKIIRGIISPVLEGVTVKIYGVDKESPVFTLLTKADGAFRLGPLDGKIDYTVEAEKEGFVLTRDKDSKEYKFLARKLAEISVKVVDSKEPSPLQGVLISLSGGGGGANSYRKNIQTGDDGQLVFNSLSPGEYYLRPTMKEYRFEPASRTIRVEEGKTVHITLTGQRVAFSAYGITTSLNGEPEPGLIVEAKGQAECSDLLEETVSKEDGSWRIRGLQPQCMYAIKLRLSQEPGARVLKPIPSSIAVQATQDVHNIKLIAFQPILRTDVTVRVISNALEHYRTIKVKLSRENSPDSPLHVIKIEAPYPKYVKAGKLVPFPPLQLDGRKYAVQLDTTLSKANYEYKLETKYFEANQTFKYVEMHFVAEPKHDHGETHQITFVPLPIIALLTLAFFNREALSSWLYTTMEKWSRRTSATNSRNKTTADNYNAVSNMDIDQIAEAIQNINSKGSKKPKPRKT